jgi:hypothetical protein
MATPTSSFMKSLFFGEIREDLLFPFPKLEAAQAETVRMVLEAVNK